MWNLINPNNFLGRTLTWVADMVILNLLYILFCLPVITAGAATSALYYTTVRMADGTFTQPWRDFWRGFRDNFRAVTPIWVVALLYGGLVGYLLLMNRLGAWGGEPVLGIYIALGAVAALLILFCDWVFALQMRFDNPRRVLLKNAVLFTVRYLPSLLLLETVCVTFQVLILSDMPYWIVLILCGFSLPAYLKGRYFSRNFNKLIAVFQPDALPPKPEEDEE